MTSSQQTLPLAETAAKLADKRDRVFQQWIDDLIRGKTIRTELLDIHQLRARSAELFNEFLRALRCGDISLTSEEAQGVRSQMADLSRLFASRGFSPSETTAYVFSLKYTVIDFLQEEYKDNPDVSRVESLGVGRLIDNLGQLTYEAFARAREQVIQRQQDELDELSISVIQMWNGILVLPIIGTLDSSRALLLTERLLDKIAQSNSGYAIIDITGVPAVDTATAQHLMKTVQAVHLMGAECIISGIRPSIATTMVNLGVELTGIVTKFSLADALRLCFQRMGLKVVPIDGPGVIG